MKYSRAILVIVWIGLTVTSVSTVADPITGGFLFAFRDNEGASPVGTGQGDNFTIGIVGFSPSAAAGTSGRAINLDTLDELILGNGIDQGRPDLVGLDIPFDQAVANGWLTAWEIILTNGLDTRSEFTVDRTGVPKMEFVKNLAISGPATVPTVTWQLPTTGPAVDAIGYEIWDVDAGVILTPGQLNLAAITETLMLDNVSLEIGGNYAARIVLINRDGGNGTLTRSSNWIGWTATSGQAEGEVLELVTGSPVGVSQIVNTPATAFVVEFDYSFATTTGDLEVFIDGNKIGTTLTAPGVVENEFYHAVFEVEDASLLGLAAVTFLVQLDGPTGSTVLVDNIEFAGIANGDFSSEVAEWTPTGAGTVQTVLAPSSLCGATLTKNTKLDEDMNCPGTALRFSGKQSSNVTLDCKGHSISAASGSAIFASGVEGVTIKNCVILASGRSARGIELTNGTSKSRVTNNDISVSGLYSRAIEINRGSNENKVTGNTLNTSGGSASLRIRFAGKNTVSDNTIEADASYAISILSASKNKISGNTLVSPEGWVYHGNFGLQNGALGVDSSGNIYAIENDWGSSAGFGTATASFGIDPSTGAADTILPVLIGGTDVGFGFDALDVLPDGRILALAGNSGNKSSIYEINATTREATAIALNLPALDGKPNGLEATSNTTLLATTNAGELLNIDLTNGNVTEIGQQETGWTDLATHPTNGKTYAISRHRDEASETAHLYEIDIGDGQIVTEIGDTGQADFSSIDFALDETLYGSTGQSGLVSVDITTGLATPIGAFGADTLEPLSRKNKLQNNRMQAPDGSINFPGSITLPSVPETDISGARVRIGANEVEVDSTALPFLDEPARIVLDNLTGDYRNLLIDPEDDGSFVTCDSPQCKLVSFQNGKLLFDVQGFTTYGSEENTNPDLEFVVNQISANVKALERDPGVSRAARKKLKSANKKLVKANKFLNKKDIVKALLEIRKAAKDLKKAEDKGAMLAELLITLLVEASRSVAQIAIDEAVAVLGEQSLIDAARAHMNAAQIQLNKGKPDKTIGEFRLAWLSAQKAAKKGPVYQDRFAPTRPNQMRIEHTATPLPDGTILITGGRRSTSTPPYDSAEIYDPATGLFRLLANPMSSPRFSHTATLLGDGTVLITGGISTTGGGYTIFDSAEIYDPATGLFTPLPFKMNSARQAHAATLLNDGRVLITGDDGGSAEIYDPVSGLFGALGNSMVKDRVYHTATLLNDGRVLITGGFFANTSLDTAEIYDPGTGLFTALASDTMNSARSNHSATLLGDGTVLVAGGYDADGDTGIDSAEVYDPVTGLFTTLANSMTSTRFNHTATLLSDGRVVFIGGSDALPNLVFAETYDPISGEFSMHATTAVLRSDHSATRLLDGRVLIAGNGLLSNRDRAELYDPATHVFTLLANTMISPRGGHTATMLADGTGRVLIAGGFDGAFEVDSAETYDPDTGLFSPVANPMASTRSSHTATLMKNGTILITGGYSDGDTLDSAEIYDPTSGVFGPLANAMITARLGHSATLLDDGRVLIVGGRNDGGSSLDSAEVYDPATGQFSPILNPMTIAREFHTATLLRDGRVLISGGYNSGPNNLDSAEVFDPGTGLFSTLAEPMTTLADALVSGRAHHTATLLDGGRVLIVGGERGDFFYTETSEGFF